MDCIPQNQTYIISANSDPCTPQPTQQTTTFQSIKPWFFKPRKIKYGLQGDFKKIKKYNSLHWSQEENEKYVNFLKGFIELIKGDTLQKRKYHLNRMLSKQVGSRSPTQCRSHHQKMIKAFKTPEAIIRHFEAPKVDTPIQTFQSQSQDSEEPNMELSTKLDLETHKSSEKIECLQINGLGGNEQASLWDILTYQGFQNSFDHMF